MSENLETKVKKNNSGIIILSILLVLVILLFVGYVLVDQEIISFNNNSKDEVVEEEAEKSVELDVNSTEVKYLHSMTEYSIMIKPGINQEVYGNKKLTVNEMSDAYKQNVVSGFYAAGVYGQETLDSSIYVEAGAVESAYELVFGEGHYKKELPAKYQCMDMNYDASTNRYTTTWIPCGVAGSDYAYEVPLKAVKYDDRIEITVGVVFQYFEDGNYGDYEKTKKLEGVIGGDNNDSLHQSYVALVNNNIDKVSQYKYTFKLNKNGFYNYYSVERVKN